nr:serine/threonine-protein phosphatase 7 long form homolog [Ipomoea batatas]
MSRRYLHLGPIDSSLLTFQVHLRSESVWANREYNSLLHCAHYASATCRNVVSNDRIDRLLWEARSLAITRLCYMKLDHHLITALVERWRPEVHAFHLPFGEVTITLQDVEVLLGLKVDGRPVIGKIDQSKLVRFAQIENLLGFTPNQDDFNTIVLKITSLETHVAAFDVSTANDEQCEQYVRRLILLFMGGLLFPETTRNKVKLCLLDFLEDISIAGQYSWGSAVLAFLYRSLCRAAHYESSIIGGCLILLQLWAWERLPCTRPAGVLPFINGNRPYGAKYL